MECKGLCSLHEEMGPQMANAQWEGVKKRMSSFWGSPSFISIAPGIEVSKQQRKNGPPKDEAPSAPRHHQCRPEKVCAGNLRSPPPGFVVSTGHATSMENARDVSRDVMNSQVEATKR